MKSGALVGCVVIESWNGWALPGPQRFRALRLFVSFPDFPGGTLDAALNRKSLMFGIPGIVIQFGAFAFITPATPPATSTLSPTGYAVLIAGYILFFIGMCCYAKAKGYSGWLALLALLSWFGLIILALLPDKNPNSTKRT